MKWQKQKYVETKKIIIKRVALSCYRGNLQYIQFTNFTLCHIVLFNLTVDFQGGRTALHTAALNGHTDIADVLLRAGASVELRASDGDTAVLLAGRYRHSAVFDRLIAATDSTVPLFSVTDQAGLYTHKNTFALCANCEIAQKPSTIMPV